jgi:RNA polymerase sigma-70 factor (ECF subfamily)
MFQQCEDHELVLQYANGNEQSLVILIERHKEKLFGYVYNLVRDYHLAEDIFQETFFKMIKTIKRNGYNEEGKFISWMMRIAHNLVIDYFRRENKYPMIEQDDEFDIFSIIKTKQISQEEMIVKKQIKKDLRKLIFELPFEQKEVLIMRMYHDMSFKEIADMTDVSINTALGRMRYAIINLKKMIQEKKVVVE